MMASVLKSKVSIYVGRNKNICCGLLNIKHLIDDIVASACVQITPVSQATSPYKFIEIYFNISLNLVPFPLDIRTQQKKIGNEDEEEEILR